MLRIISALILAVTAVCASAQTLALVDNPPERYIVVRGDTLWGISGRFLKEPWRWPEIWRMNRAEIKNPHLIYPGDVIVLDYVDGQPRLRLAKPVGGKPANPGPGRLQPRVYSEAVVESLSSIPPNVIEPFISQPLVIEPGEHDDVPRIVATQEDRMMVGTGDEAFVSGIPDARTERWHVFRPGKPMKDPETGEIIGHEAFFLGNARLVRPGEPATVRVTLAKQEIMRGDRLLPAPPPEIMAYVPRRPEATINARILSIYGGVNEGGVNSVVALNRGRAAGLEPGDVLALYRNRVSLSIDEGGKRVSTPVPEERYALAFVFRTFDRVAYALVVDAARSVIVGDSARNP